MILVVAEHAGGTLAKSFRQLISAARGLGREGRIAVLVLGSGIAEIAQEAALYAGQVLVADRAELAAYDPEFWAAAVAQVAAKAEAHTVLIAGSRAGREYSPRVAVKLGAAFFEDVFTLQHARGATTGERYAYLARVLLKIESQAPVVVATAKLGAFPQAAPLTETESAKAKHSDVEFQLPKRRIETSARESARGARVSLSDAEIVVSGGRGVGTADAFAQWIEPLADRLGAAVGATRAIVDSGWRPYSEQVGQTGKTVQPKVYIAAGISGAVQHLSGMNKSKYIVAINKDADAPIFQSADLGIVGDACKVVQAMLRLLDESRKEPRS